MSRAFPTAKSGTQFSWAIHNPMTYHGTASGQKSPGVHHTRLSHDPNSGWTKDQRAKLDSEKLATTQKRRMLFSGKT